MFIQVCFSIADIFFQKRAFAIGSSSQVELVWIWSFCCGLFQIGFWFRIAEYFWCSWIEKVLWMLVLSFRMRCWFDFRWISGGFQMDFRWISGGFQIGVFWILVGFLVSGVFRFTSSGLLSGLDFLDLAGLVFSFRLSGIGFFCWEWRFIGLVQGSLQMDSLRRFQFQGVYGLSILLDFGHFTDFIIDY